MPDPSPRRTLRCALPLLVVLLAATLLGPTPAYAEHLRHHDAEHDVRRTSDGRPGSRPASRRREPDVTVVKVGYNRQRLRVTTWVRQLSPDRNHAVLVQIVTPHYTGGVYVTQVPRRHVDTASLVVGAGRTVDCPGLQFHTWFAKGVISVVVPRSCLSDPRWVRVGFAVSWTTRSHAFSDDGLSRQLGGAAVLTRRLRVG